MGTGLTGSFPVYLVVHNDAITERVVLTHFSVSWDHKLRKGTTPNVRVHADDHHRAQAGRRLDWGARVRQRLIRLERLSRHRRAAMALVAQSYKNPRRNVSPAA